MRTDFYTVGLLPRWAYSVLLIGAFLSQCGAQIGPPPIIAVQPQDTRVLVGGTAIFSVVAVSVTGLSYKWFKGDTTIQGASSSILILNNVVATNIGEYWVEVKNGGGKVNSRAAILGVAVNLPPVANTDAFAAVEDVPLVIPVAGVLANDTDPNSGLLVALLTTNASGGTLNLNTNGSFQYKPPTNFFGTASFSYRAQSLTATILEQNRSGGSKVAIKKGKAGAQSFRHGTTGGRSYTISKVVVHLSRESTAPNANLRFSIGTGVNSGTLAGSTVAISPASVTNSSAGSSFQEYEIKYATPVGSLAAGTTYYLNLECDASNGKEFYIERDSNSYANGTYYEDGDNEGVDTWFQILENPVSTPATVTILVAPSYDLPLVSNDFTNTLEDVSVVIRVLDNDIHPDITPLTIQSALTTNGTATVSGNTIRFTPATNFHGVVVFNYNVSDGTSLVVGSVTVNVDPINDAPLGVAETYTTVTNLPIVVSAAGGVLTNDLDVEGDAFSAILVSNVSHGTLNLAANGGFTYTPALNFQGLDSFSYRPVASSATGALTTVSLIIVNPVPSVTVSGLTEEGFNIQASIPIGRTYIIEASTNFIHWDSIVTNVALTGTVQFTDTSATNRLARYYRTLVR